MGVCVFGHVEQLRTRYEQKKVCSGGRIADTVSGLDTISDTGGFGHRILGHVEQFEYVEPFGTFGDPE